MSPSNVEPISKPWNFSWIVENRLAASSCPRTEESLNFLKTEGIKHLVTLSPDHMPPMDNFEGLHWTYIPVEEFEPPTLEDVQKFIDVCEDGKSKNEAVAIHCRAGRGRTGVMVACYFVHFLDMAPKTAISKIRSMRPGSVETYDQERAVVLYHDFLRSR